MTENPIYARNTLEFVTVAVEFCALMEKSVELDKEEFVGTLLKLLPLLYMKVQLLPEVDSDGSFAPSGQVTEDDYNFVCSCAYQLLRDHDDYEMLVWDEAMQTEESRWQSVSEGLADIYQALRNFVAVYQQRLEMQMQDALYEVHEAFTLYWGQTLLDTLRQLHRIHYTFTRDDDEEDS